MPAFQSEGAFAVVLVLGKSSTQSGMSASFAHQPRHWRRTTCQHPPYNDDICAPCCHVDYSDALQDMLMIIFSRASAAHARCRMRCVLDSSLMSNRPKC